MQRTNQKIIFFHYPRVSTGAHPLTKKSEDSGYEIGGGLQFLINENLKTRPQSPFETERAIPPTRGIPAGWEAGANSERRRATDCSPVGIRTKPVN